MNLSVTRALVHEERAFRRLPRRAGAGHGGARRAITCGRAIGKLCAQNRISAYSPATCLRRTHGGEVELELELFARPIHPGCRSRGCSLSFLGLGRVALDLACVDARLFLCGFSSSTLFAFGLSERLLLEFRVVCSLLRCEITVDEIVERFRTKLVSKVTADTP